jgi:hypothetical protein
VSIFLMKSVFLSVYLTIFLLLNGSLDLLSLQAGWGQCSQSWMAEFCQKTCGTCPCQAPGAPPCTCTDIQPNLQYTCAQQVLPASVNSINDCFLLILFTHHGRGHAG